MSAYENFKDNWRGKEAALCSMAISLKRIADRLTADDKRQPHPDDVAVDLSQLRPGDVVALHGGDIRARDGGRLAIVLHVDPPRDGRYWVTAAVASQGSAMRLSSPFTATGAAAVSASDERQPLTIVRVIKGAADE